MFNTQNLKFLGSGMYANVYDTGDGRVVKHAQEMDGCYHYLKWIITTIAWRRHSCCPRVYELIVDENNGGYWCVMEKLNPLCFEAKEDWNFRQGHLHRYDHLVVYKNETPTDPIGLMLCDYLDQHQGRYLGCCDLHSDNVMLREDGTLVATDPFC